MNLFYTLSDKLINYAKKTPYSHIGVYMRRWWIVPYKHECRFSFRKHPFGWLLQKFDIAIRIHEILKSDEANALHCHPWWYITVILKGGYKEVTPIYKKDASYCDYKSTYYGSGSILIRSSKSRHRLEIVDNNIGNVHAIPVTTTLFITFKKQKSWGFYKRHDKFIHYKEHLEEGRP